MESAIQLKCGYLPNISPGISSTIGIGNATKFQLNYNRTSTSLSCKSRHQVTPVLSQVPCKGYSFSGIFRNGDYKRRKSTSINAQMQLASPKEALKSLLGMSKFLATNEPLSYAESPEIHDVGDIKNLKKYVLWLIKCGKPSEAVDTLYKQYTKAEGAKTAEEGAGPEIAHFLDLTIVEIHICLGQYIQAAERPCIQVEIGEVGPSDSRIPLYKAILHTILDENENALKWWEEFMKTVRNGGLSNIPIQPLDPEDDSY